VEGEKSVGYGGFWARLTDATHDWTAQGAIKSPSQSTGNHRERGKEGGSGGGEPQHVKKKKTYILRAKIKKGGVKKKGINHSTEKMRVGEGANPKNAKNHPPGGQPSRN